MPRTPIDYSKCLIYKIACKDPKINDIYVGHTTDKITRKSKHRSNCNNKNSKQYNFYVYQFIRDHGNFDNWEMIILEEYPCENINQATLRERYFLETLGATLNRQVPSRTHQEYIETNREILNEKQRQYKEQNQEYYQQYYQQYREQNIEKLDEYIRQYREQNKNKLQENFECECGGKYTRENRAKHFKTKKHLNYYYLNNLQSV